MSPGSLPLSREVYQEGVIIPPVKWRNEGKVVADLERLILRNVRTPEERRGDLAAQQAAHAVAETRLAALIERHGAAEAAAYAAWLPAWSERLLRECIREWPDGVFRFEDTMEPEFGEASGGEPLVVRVAAHIQGGGVTFDFEGTSPATDGSLNAPLPVTEAACYYAVRALVAADIPMNAGCFAPVRVAAPPGCLVHARPPRAVAAGNVETSQRIVDAVFGALGQALPNRACAAGQGTMNNLTIGGFREDGSPLCVLRNHWWRHGGFRRGGRPRRGACAHEQHAEYAGRGAGNGVSVSGGDVCGAVAGAAGRARSEAGTASFGRIGCCGPPR